MPQGPTLISQLPTRSKKKHQLLKIENILIPGQMGAYHKQPAAMAICTIRLLHVHSICTCRCTFDVRKVCINHQFSNILLLLSPRNVFPRQNFLLFLELKCTSGKPVETYYFILQLSIRHQIKLCMLVCF
jgi:hypothetical protein